MKTKPSGPWRLRWVRVVSLACIGVLLCFTGGPAFAQTYVPGGTLDPTTIPKYVTPLVIPPQMPKSTASPAPAADYDIAVRQFQQQILPGGIWGASFPSPAGGGATVGPFPATTVWSYGRAEDPAPDSSGIGGAAGVAPAQNSSFNYPAFTVENTSKAATTVRWINGLVDGSGNYLPQLFPVDQTVHWANPPNSNCAMGDPNRTDCESTVPTPYTGPVPIVTHVHGAHVQPHSDGYPEAWWLPAANNIPAGYAVQGSNYGQADNTNTVPGSAYFSYENTQPAATIWYHDHALGMTRLNVMPGRPVSGSSAAVRTTRPRASCQARRRPLQAAIRTSTPRSARRSGRCRSRFRTGRSTLTVPSSTRRTAPFSTVSPAPSSGGPGRLPGPRTSTESGTQRPSSTRWWSTGPPGRNSMWRRLATA